jgi:hypothetical protein
MDAKQYMEKHPEQYAAILKEGEQNGAKAAITAEQDRIKSIESLMENFSSSAPAAKLAVSSHIANAKFDTTKTAPVVALELLKIANDATGKQVGATASAKRAEAEIAGDIPEGSSDEDGSGDGEDAAQAKARVSNIANGIKAGRK